MKFVDPDGKAYTYQVSENEFRFTSDICVLDKFFSDLSGLIPGSALAKRLSDATTDLNRIEGTSTADVIRCTGSDVILEVMNKSDSSILKSVGKFLNRMNIVSTLWMCVKDLFNNQTVGTEQFIQSEFSNVLKGTSRENVEALYSFTKKKVNDFISVGYITLDIDKKGILKSYRINNQLAIDMLYCELRNLQLKLNIGSTNE